jgi:hypothetical protein
MLKGQHETAEHKLKISLALKGTKRRPLSIEHKLSISNTLKGHIPWNKNKKTGPFKYKDPIGRAKKISASRMGMIFSDEHLKNLSLSHIGIQAGDKNPAWIKDRSKVLPFECRTLLEEYRQWRATVFRRDKYTCQIKNEDCKGKLEAHHILPWRDYPELRYEINNGITLCIKHHPRKHAEESRLSPYFQEIIKTKPKEKK